MFIIDRFENGYAVCETEKMNFINIDVSLLPDNVKEGDVIIRDEDGRLIIKNDDADSRRKALIREKMNRLWK